MTIPAAKPTRHIGLDFDNTIVLYDAVFADLGREAGLLPLGFAGGKGAVRAHIRALPQGEAKWTALQAKVYGPGIKRAVPAPGLFDALGRLAAAGWRLSIVSHKTEFAAAEPDGMNLREAARGWIARHGLTDRFGIQAADIHFLPTREEKITRIIDAGCTDFVDDLVEVFQEKDFPPAVRQYLYTPGGPHPHERGGPWTGCATWQEIGDALLNRHAA